MRRRRGTTSLLAVLVLLGAARAFAGPPPEIPAVSERHDGGRWIVEGSFEVPVPARAAWEVLTDYDHLPRFVSGMSRSTVRERREGEVVVEQQAVARVLFFERAVRIVLALAEEPVKAIRFHDLDLHDFEVYEGFWTLAEDAGRTRVLYHLEAKPRTALPAFVGGSVLQSSATELLGEVRQEMLRRLAPAAPIAGK